MEQINTEKFDELLKGGKPVVCDFFATWCLSLIHISEPTRR